MMTQLNIKTLCNNISNTFRAMKLTTIIYDIDEIKDNIPPDDMPLLMVYPETSEGDTTGSTQQTTFGGGANRPVQNEEATINVDIYVETIGGKPINEWLPNLIDAWDEVLTFIRAQTIQPYFGDEQIKAYQWDIARVELKYSGQSFSGIQVSLSIREF